MAHWHNFNPLAATCVYLSEEDLSSFRRSGDWLHGYGNKLYYYILPKRHEAGYSAGVRYGKEPHEYLSFLLNPSLGESYLEKYKVKV
jgi:hypothetical protein